jgi:CheY-like chemotaxis protein
VSRSEGANEPTRVDLKGVRVLVADDQWHAAIALKSLLEAEGMAVTGPAATPADALPLAIDPKPDLAVIDLNLRGEMAYALIDQLHDQGIRIVVASGYAVMPVDMVAHVLQKPFNGPEMAALRRAISF